MNYFQDENIGIESTLPNEIIDLLNSYKLKNNKQSQLYVFMTNTPSFLDEHEQAMTE